MSLRELVEPDCQGANSLMRLGNHIRHDAAFKDEGFGPSTSFTNRSQQFGPDQLVQEFLGQIAPPQTFRMDALLQEMREIDAQSFHNHIARAPPPIIEEVHNGFDWANEFSKDTVQLPPAPVDHFAAIESNEFNEYWNQPWNPEVGVTQSMEAKRWDNEFLDVNASLQEMVSIIISKFNYSVD